MFPVLSGQGLVENDRAKSRAESRCSVASCPFCGDILQGTHVKSVVDVLPQFGNLFGDHTWRIITRCHVFGNFQVAIKQNDFSSLSHFEFIFRGRTRPPPILATEAAEGARRNPGPHGQAGSGAPQGASTWRSWDPALTSTDWAL